MEDGFAIVDHVVRVLEAVLGLPLANQSFEHCLALDQRNAAEVLPIAFEGKKLVLAMADPGNVFALDDIRQLTRLELLPVVATTLTAQEPVLTPPPSFEVER